MSEQKNESPKEDKANGASLHSRDDHTKSEAMAEGAEGILGERLENLAEALEEIDEALEARKVLNARFRAQIHKEIDEVHHQLGFLQAPWRMGFEPRVEFLRLSFHKSLTSRRKDLRSEELKLWDDLSTLRRERRKLLDEYKSLLSTQRRLTEEG